MKKNDFFGDNNLDAYNREREKKNKILEQIKKDHFGNNHDILRELYNNGISKGLSLADLKNSGFKDDNAIKSNPSITNSIFCGVVFHKKTHYECFDLECIGKYDSTFNIIKTENSPIIAELLNSIRNLEILIEALGDAASESRFELNKTMEEYYEKTKVEKINELKILQLKLEEKSNSDKKTLIEHKTTKEELQKLIKELETQYENNPTDGLKARIKGLKIVLKYKK